MQVPKFNEEDIDPNCCILFLFMDRRQVRVGGFCCFWTSGFLSYCYICIDVCKTQNNMWDFCVQNKQIFASTTILNSGSRITMGIVSCWHEGRTKWVRKTNDRTQYNKGGFLSAWRIRCHWCSICAQLINPGLVQLCVDSVNIFWHCGKREVFCYATRGRSRGPHVIVFWSFRTVCRAHSQKLTY